LLNDRVVWMALLVLATAPEAMMPPIFKYQTLAILIFCIILYLVYRLISSPDRPVTQVMLLAVLLLVLIITHHYTSVIATAFLFALALSLMVRARWPFKGRSMRVPAVRYGPQVFVMGAITAIMLFLWWDHYATVAWPWVGKAAERFIAVLNLMRNPMEFSWENIYPPSLIVDWAIVLERIRDVVMFLPSLWHGLRGNTARGGADDGLDRVGPGGHVFYPPDIALHCHPLRLGVGARPARGVTGGARRHGADGVYVAGGVLGPPVRPAAFL
jgi:hypothetical protein